MELSPEAYIDFMKGRVTSKLHGEIIHLYAHKNNLNSYIQMARYLKHNYLLEFLKDPTRHPLVINYISRAKLSGAGKLDDNVSVNIRPTNIQNGHL
jgi:hypothetical protein